jgi:arylsulfatase A-like enzyme
MEGDAIFGKMLDAVSELDLEQDTIVVFPSDNGPDGPGAGPHSSVITGH